MSERREPRVGRLKVFLGAAPGVGKTYEMLRAAQNRCRDGTDVVIGFIETHGRQETEELLKGLEIIPRRPTAYKGHIFGEMDVDAILERAPELAIVDELAHSNLPGSRNAKRYQDVEGLIAKGIDVFTTLNVQHIEGLADIVAKSIWVVVRETVPDSFLDSADEIEVVDLPPVDLIRRVEEGKVDLSGQAVAGTRSFFSDRNLTSLRTLSLQYAKPAPIRRVLIPFDGSASAIRAVQHVVALARAGHRGEVFLLNVQSSTSEGVGLAPDRRSAGEAILQKAAYSLDAQHILHRCEVVAGKPPDAILAASDRHDIHLIVMGTRGMGALAQFFLGSVATAVTQSSEIPVTLIK